MLRMLIISSLFNIILAQDPVNDNPCENHETLRADTRLYSITMGDNCDDNITQGWYKFQFTTEPFVADIPTTCIKNNFGNTRLPMRLELSGKTLPGVNMTISAHLCTSYNILDHWDCCVLRQDTWIRNCGDFYVYYLRPVDRCPVAYVVQVRNVNPTGLFTAKTNEQVVQSNTSTGSTPVTGNTVENSTDRMSLTTLSSSSSSSQSSEGNEIGEQMNESASASLTETSTQSPPMTSAMSSSDDSSMNSTVSSPAPTSSTINETDSSSPGLSPKERVAAIENTLENTTVVASSPQSSSYSGTEISTSPDSAQTSDNIMRTNQTTSATMTTSSLSNLDQNDKSQRVATESVQNDQNTTMAVFSTNTTESTTIISTHSETDHAPTRYTEHVTEGLDNDTISTSVDMVSLSSSSVTSSSSSPLTTTPTAQLTSSSLELITFQNLTSPQNETQSTLEDHTSVITQTIRTDPSTSVSVTSGADIPASVASTLLETQTSDQEAPTTPVSESVRPSTQVYTDMVSSPANQTPSTGFDIVSEQQVTNASKEVTRPLPQEPISVSTSVTPSTISSTPESSTQSTTSSSIGISKHLTTSQPPDAPRSSTILPSSELPSTTLPSSSASKSSYISTLSTLQVIQTSTSLSNITNDTIIVDDDDDSDDNVLNIIGDNPGLFVFLIATGVVLFGVSIFGIVGLCYFRRLRTWRPEMSFQDAYAETEKTVPSEIKEKQGVGSPIPDVDILRGEEVDSPSKASTLVCSPTPDRMNTLNETSQSDVLGDISDQNGFQSTPLKPPALYADMGTGQDVSFQGDTLQEGEGVVPINEWDQLGNRNMFPWIEAAEDTKL